MTSNELPTVVGSSSDSAGPSQAADNTTGKEEFEAKMLDLLQRCSKIVEHLKEVFGYVPYNLYGAYNN